MKSRAMLLCLPLVLSTLVFSACSSPRDAAERYIKQSESEWAASVATNDASVLRRILADDFVEINPDGSIWTKAQTVADAKAGPGDFVSDHIDYVHVRFFGNTAVVQGSETWERKKARQHREGHFIFTDVWVLRNGQWQVIQSEDVVSPSGSMTGPFTTP